MPKLGRDGKSLFQTNMEPKVSIKLNVQPLLVASEIENDCP